MSEIFSLPYTFAVKKYETDQMGKRSSDSVCAPVQLLYI